MNHMPRSGTYFTASRPLCDALSTVRCAAHPALSMTHCQQYCRLSAVQFNKGSVSCVGMDFCWHNWIDKSSGMFSVLFACFSYFYFCIFLAVDANQDGLHKNLVHFSSFLWDNRVIPSQNGACFLMASIGFANFTQTQRKNDQHNASFS